ncbi:MAG: hypothetical protein LN560_01745 [Rickettsia endosymbiont of Sceptobius lativentris]|nr:hypothetical protein [Rickettsia endosymbiont of Sceptobius lativentris]
MKISFSFFKQLLELLTSDWRSYLNKVITELEKLALTDTNDTFLKEECYRKIALIKGYIKEGEYPWYVVPFDKKDNASLLLTNIHMLELDYLNQNTVKAVKNMLRNNFKDIYNPEIYIIANYEEHTNEELKYIDDIVNDIRKLDSELVADISNIIKFIYQFYFVDSAITQYTIIFIAAHFEELPNFHQNLDNLNFIVPLQKYNPECQPKNHKNFINIEAITWNRFLVKYQKLFNNLSEEHSEILCSICSDNEDFIKSLLSDSLSLDLEKQTKTITYVMDKYKGDTDSCHITRLFNICNNAIKLKIVKLLILNSISLDLEKRIEILKYVTDKYKDNTDSICHITTQLFNICKNTTKPEVVKYFIDYLEHWKGLPIFWCYNDMLPIGEVSSKLPSYDYE